MGPNYCDYVCRVVSLNKVEKPMRLNPHFRMALYSKLCVRMDFSQVEIKIMIQLLISGFVQAPSTIFPKPNYQISKAMKYIFILKLNKNK